MRIRTAAIGMKQVQVSTAQNRADGFKVYTLPGSIWGLCRFVNTPLGGGGGGKDFEGVPYFNTHILELGYQIHSFDTPIAIPEQLFYQHGWKSRLTIPLAPPFFHGPKRGGRKSGL